MEVLRAGDGGQPGPGQAPLLLLANGGQLIGAQWSVMVGRYDEVPLSVGTGHTPNIIVRDVRTQG